MQKIKLFLTLVLLIFAFTSIGQVTKNILTMDDFSIESNGKTIIVENPIIVQLQQNVLKDVFICKTDFVSYHAEFTYKFEGRRVKLVRRTYAKLSNGKRIYSKKKKDMQELKVSVPGMIKGKSSESILYSKKTMGSIFVSFKYNFNYK
ncbi:MAG: hypothetical protein GY907_10485 [Bacteroidetes bacterium]|jgi:queuine/archaeosine tRNA-ribosyltransferase|nr:hypothetical protein [Bacteroidota bacterium]